MTGQQLDNPSKETPPIYFYIPQSQWYESNLPESVDTLAKIPQKYFRLGSYSWVLQTYLYLKTSGFPCQIVNSLPDEGIVFAYRTALPDDLKPGEKLLLICCQGDERRHPYAQIHIVQNPQQTSDKAMVFGDKYLLPGKTIFMPHWVQPGLISRNPQRGYIFKNSAFFGRETNLAEELRESAWENQISDLNLSWNLVKDPELWSDYSEVDAIVAVGGFNISNSYHWKPATKLYGAWHANVPAILGFESAFRAERKSELDYLEVTSFENLVAAIKRLCENADLRKAMVENGQMRAQETQSESLIKRWYDLFIKTAIPAYENWSKSSSWTKQAFLMRCELSLQTRDMRKNIHKIRNSLGIRSHMRSLFSKVN